MPAEQPFRCRSARDVAPPATWQSRRPAPRPRRGRASEAATTAGSRTCRCPGRMRRPGWRRRCRGGRRHLTSAAGSGCGCRPFRPVFSPDKSRLRLAYTRTRDMARRVLALAHCLVCEIEAAIHDDQRGIGQSIRQRACVNEVVERHLATIPSVRQATISASQACHALVLTPRQWPAIRGDRSRGSPPSAWPEPLPVARVCRATRRHRAGNSGRARASG